MCFFSILASTCKCVLLSMAFIYSANIGSYHLSPHHMLGTLNILFA